MSYKEMIIKARENGVATEKAMYAGIDQVDDLLSSLKSSHPDEYWKFIRKAHEDLYGPHYDEEFAEYDISHISYIDSNGVVRHGAHWTKDEVLNATVGKIFPSGTTDCDKWVAYNAAYADFCKSFDEPQILEIAFLFYFADDDWKGKGKVWKYMNCNTK